MAKEFSLDEAFGPPKDKKEKREFSLAEAFGPPPERTKTEAVTDVAAPFLSGIGSLLKVPGQIYGLTTGAIKDKDFNTTGLQGIGTDIEEWAKKQYSEKLKYEQAETERKVAEAEKKDGQAKAFATGFGEVISSPTQLPAFIAEQAAMAIPTAITAAIPGVGPAAALELRLAIAAASKLAKGTAAREAAEAAVKIAADNARKSAVTRGTTAAIGTGAVQQGADIGEGSFQEIKNYLIKEKKMSEEQASNEALNLARATGVAGAGVSLLAQKLPGAKAFERALAGEKLGTGRLMGAATGALKNIPDELVEELGGKVSQNVAMQQVNPEQSLTAGLGSTAAQALLGATAIGGGAGALAGGKPTVSKEDLQAAQDLKRREEVTKLAKAERDEITKQLDVTKNPLGALTSADLGPVLNKYVEDHRTATGKPPLTEYSLEDVIDALPGKERAALSAGNNDALNALIGAKTGYTAEVYTADDITKLAKEKNVDVTTQGFEDFLGRSTGISDLALMSQPQLHSAAIALQKLPAFKQTQSLPEGSNATRYSDEQYTKALEGLNTAMDNVGADELDFKKVTKAVETATGLKGSAVNELLNDATRKGDIVSADKKVSIPSRTMPGGYNVEEKIGEEEDQADSYDIMRGDERIMSTSNQESANKEIESLQRTTDLATKKAEAELKSQQDKITKSEDELNTLKIEGKYGTPEYTTAEAKHQEVLDTAWPIIGEQTAKIESYAKPLDIKPIGAKKVKPKTYTVRKGERTVKEAADRAAAEEEIFKDLTDQELQDLSKKRSPALLKRVNAEIQRRAAEPKPEPKKITPELEQQRKLLEQNLPKLLAKFGLQDVGLKIMDAIENDAEGSYAAKIIQIALGIDQPVRVLRHESLHALKALGFFTPQQWAVLEREAENKWVDKYLKTVIVEVGGQQMTRYEAYANGVKDAQGKFILKPLTKEALLEEAIADAFADFDVNKAPPGMMSALLNKLRNFFSVLKGYLNDQGYEKAEDIFTKIEKGELKATQPVTEGEAKLSLAPEGIPQKLWDLHNKAMAADQAASTWNAGARKATATKASNRLVRAVDEYFSDDYQAQMAIMTKMNEESNRRGEGFFGTPKYSLSGIGSVPLSTRNLMEKQTPVAQQELGLNTEAVRGRFNNVREIAQALNQFTLDNLGQMDRNNLTSQESSEIARAIADEVAFQLGTQAKTGTGLGWYSNNYPKAVKRLARRFPELRDNKHARSVFSALVAITSNGEKVNKNIDNAITLYAKLRDGKPLVAMGNRRATALENNLKMIQDLLKRHGTNFEKVLLQEITVKEMNARLREMGEDTDGSYLKDTTVPAAAVYFGPKLGAFYANLSGSEGYLTMDLWWTRSINRMRGLLMPQATDASINKFRDMMDMPSATRDEVIAATIPLRNKYEEYGWSTELEHLAKGKEPAKKDKKPAWFKKAKAKAGAAYDQLLFEHNLEKMANTIYKNEYEMLEEAPFTATDRKFMYDAGRKAQDMLRKDGINLTLADIQAALWYYEKRLYEKLSGRKADDIGYEEAIIAQSGKTTGRARPSVVFDTELNGRDESGGAVKDVEELRGKSDYGPKYSLREAVRSYRGRNESEPGTHTRESIEDGEGIRVLGVTPIARYKPTQGFKDIISDHGFESPVFYEINGDDAQTYADAIQASKDSTEYGAAVFVYPVEEYAKMRLFLTQDGKSGIALKKDDIVSVFSGKPHRGSANSSLQLAVQEGGRRLDAFATILPTLYHANGFKAVGRMTWNEEYIPDNWNKITFEDYNNGEPDVVYMSYNPDDTTTLTQSPGEYYDDSDELVAAQVKAVKDYFEEGEGYGSRKQNQRTGKLKASAQEFPDQRRVRRDIQLLDDETRAKYPYLEEPVEGLPAKAIVDGVEITFGPYIPAREAAILYAEKMGIPYRQQASYHKLDKNFSTLLANTYASMLNRPLASDVKEAYEAWAKETIAQYEAMIKTGITIEFMPNNRDPYGNPRNAILDVINNNHLYVFPADGGFGKDAITEKQIRTNPALALTDIIISGRQARVVEVFRATHDFYGHVKEGFGFRAEGEENAFQSHVRMYSPLAARAMTAGTRGQNSDVNFGPNAEFNKTASGEDTIYADQKIGLMPEWATDSNIEPDVIGKPKLSLRTFYPTAEAAEDAAYRKAPPTDNAFKRWFGKSIVKEEGRPLVMYHASRVDFNAFRENAPIFISPYAKEAEYFGRAHEDESVKSEDKINVYPLWVRAEKPFDFENSDNLESLNFYLDSFYGKDSDLDVTALSKKIAEGDWDTIESPEVQESIRGLGFDSFYVKENGKKNLAVFDANQVKSATGNSGEFGETKDMRFSLRNVPSEPGTEPIPKGTVRLYHQTNADSLEKIAKEGLSIKYAKGIEGPKAIYAGETPFYGAADSRPTLEFYVPKEQWDAPFVLEDVKSEQIIAAHSPWHKTARYLESEPQSMQSALDGQFDELKDEDTAKAVQYIKDKYGKPTAKLSLRVASDIQNMPNGVNAYKSITEKSTAREEEGFVERMMKAIGSEGRSSFRQKAINRYEGQSVNDKKIADMMGGIELLADASSEAAALQSDTAAGIAAAAMGYGDSQGGVPVYDKGYTTISDLNGTVKGLTEILRPLAVHGDPFIYRAYQFYAGVKRGTRLMASGKEQLFDRNDIQYAKDLEQLYPEFKTVQQEWVKYNDGLVDYMVKTGVLTREKGREFKKYGDYVPFYRQLEGEETIGPSVFQSMSGVKQPKKIKGGEAPLADFLETVVRNTQAAIQAGTKNIAAERAIGQALVLGTASKLPQISSAPNTVTLLVNGVPTSYAVADKLLFDSMQSLHLPEMPFLSILSGPANLLRNMVTKDPGFMLANLMRDSLSAYVTSGANMTPLIDTFANFGRVMANRSPEFQKLINAGVIGGYEFSRGVADSGEALGKDLRKKTGTLTGTEKKLRPITSLWDFLEKGTEASDAATRIAVYKDVMNRTGNEAEAIRRALEVMNFNRKGSSPIIRVITAGIPFLNARIQGLDVFYRAGFAPRPEGVSKTDHQKHVQKNMLIRATTMMALSSMYWFMMKDDDEYKKQEQEVKDNNWLLPGLGVRMPIPFEVGVLFKVVPERLCAFFFGSDTGEDLAKSMERALRSTFGVNLPQTFLPLIEARTNYSYFTMRPIVGQGMEGVRPGFQTGPGTTKIAEAVGKALNESPILIDHIIQGYVGTMGMYAVNAVDSIIDTVSDSQKPSLRPDQYPIVKRFMMNPEAKGSVSAYYELKKAVDETVRTMNLLEKTGRGEELSEFMQGKHRLFGMSNAKLYGIKEYISSVDKNLKTLQDAGTMIRASKMSPQEKQEALTQVNMAQIGLTKSVFSVKGNLSQ